MASLTRAISRPGGAEDIRHLQGKTGQDCRRLRGRRLLCGGRSSRPLLRRGLEGELVEREIPEPGAGQVRIKVQACGVCHSDVYTKEGLFPGIEYPRVPGHEVVGLLDAAGSE